MKKEGQGWRGGEKDIPSLMCNETIFQKSRNVHVNMLVCIYSPAWESGKCT
jgi:hypothetical protein